jgi:hypothetical protein
MFQTIVFYYVLAAALFLMGGYLCQEMFPLWFTEKYLSGADWKLVVGGLLFWNTMYLLRYGLFLLASGVSTLLATFPIKTIGGLLALAQLSWATLPGAEATLGFHSPLTFLLAVPTLGCLFFDRLLIAAFRQIMGIERRCEHRVQETKRKLEQIKVDKSATLGVVYMSGDDLACRQLPWI